MFSVNDKWRGGHSTLLHDSLFAKESAQKQDKNPAREKSKKKKNKKEEPVKQTTTSSKATASRAGRGEDEVAAPRAGGGVGGSRLHRRAAGKLLGAKFRWLNQQLYTRTGQEALQLFAHDKELFDIYHEGFNEQVSKWPLNPLDRVIDFVGSLPKSLVIADFGCGEGRLGMSLEHTVHSFDLVSRADHVTSCDMSNVPLSDSSVDVVVFCLSLMGTDIAGFIAEACRVLRSPGGILKIIEIESRMESCKDFVAKVEKFGFNCKETNKLSKLFLDFKFVLEKKKRLKTLPDIKLAPCLYKKR